jgi:glycosyltransferase Alg8
MDLLGGHILYLLALIAFGLAVPEYLWDAEAAGFIFILGGLAMWRYSWAILNWARFLIFQRVVFPKWRKEATLMGESAMPSHVYLLVTSFRIGAETTRRVYDSVFREAIACGLPCTILASLVERGDEVFIKQLYEQVLAEHSNLSQNPATENGGAQSMGEIKARESIPPVKLIFIRIGGTGKRDALASGFRAISRQMPAEDSITAVIDGDSMLSPNLIRKCAPFFVTMPKLGALTTDESCEVEGNWLFREWYSMRFAQRHIFMGSVSLSRRVLTLTGRMSMFRTSIIASPEFIERVELDWIDHWRLGRFKFLTGDDKSSWFHLLQMEAEMIYVPDVNVMTIETPPDPSFLTSSVVLMRRWFGNMLRTNTRALALGPNTMGWFTWIAVLDQRISMWTSLTGPVVSLLATFFVTPFALIYYLLWVMFTRYIITLSFLVSRDRVSAFYPFLLYYNQVMGSLIKTIVLFRLDKQRWTRQNTTLNQTRTKLSERLASLSSTWMHLLAFGSFTIALASFAGILRPPSFNFWYQLAAGF